jgi:uncharacterized protein (TIGR02265 family)
MPPGFAPPDFSAPLEPAEFVRLTPPSATIRGVFFSNLLVMARAGRCKLQSVDVDKKYHAFKEYPLTEHVRLLAEVAAAVYPGLSLGHALRQIGQRIYPMFAGSLAGKVIFSTVGHNPSSVLSAGVKAYNVSASVGHVQVLELDDQHGHFYLEGMFNFVEQYHVGIFEGAIKVIGFVPKVLTKPRTRTSSEFYVTW